MDRQGDKIVHCINIETSHVNTYSTRSHGRVWNDRKCIEWIKGVDVEAAQLGSLFGDGNLIDTDDVCTYFANINLQDDEENALLNLAIDDAEDVAMTTAMSVICDDANSRPQTRCANKFNPQLMGMSTDQKKRDWLKRV
ncbi:hypothetical protein PC118_g2420 [Phytophthora cactorum]|uniref:Uncharacterized protein n=1 Tax=Phytophthora cactorum TaxID=29920 RepID=A0A8T1GK09_9STRA|nr:hypothetical protein PC118_g2420 [Phytophthora cactorum]